MEVNQHGKGLSLLRLDDSPVLTFPGRMWKLNLTSGIAIYGSIQPNP